MSASSERPGSPGTTKPRSISLRASRTQASPPSSWPPAWQEAHRADRTSPVLLAISALPSPCASARVRAECARTAPSPSRTKTPPREIRLMLASRAMRAKRARPEKGLDPLTRDDRPRVHDLEVAPLDLPDLREPLLVPARVGGARDEPVRAVVGDDHPVLLESVQDDLDLLGEARHVDLRLEPDPEPHGRKARVRAPAREVAGRAYVAALRLLHGEPESVLDRSLGHGLVVADEAGEDREAGGVGRGPARLPQVIRAQV